jgi:hypothetical protein
MDHYRHGLPASAVTSQLPSEVARRAARAAFRASKQDDAVLMEAEQSSAPEGSDRSDLK